MCGIAGLLWTEADTSAEELTGAVARMTATLRHRGPDDEGIWADPAAGAALGVRRLAILDLSANGHQPMTSASGRYVIAFNGEVYNFRALREELGPRGHAFRGGSDTETLLAAVEEWGLEGALRRANGMFALALWDRADRSLRLARDRLGEKPLYYGRVRGGLLFGSELKALRAHPAFRGEVDRDALCLYLRHKYVPAPWSIYRGVRKLPPGTVLTVRPGGARDDPRPVAFWSAREAVERAGADPFTGSIDEAAAELDALLRDAVRIRMEADVPLGAFLSGGVDSSTVVALMQAQSPRPVRTFTVGFAEGAFDEAPHARLVARHLGTDHTELTATPEEARDVIPLLPALYDEPFADSSQIPTFLVSRLAREHVTVTLSGDGGDEVFGGYNRHVWVERIWRRVAVLPRWLRSAAAGGLSAVAPATWDALADGLGARLLAGRAAPRLVGEKVHKLAGVLGAEGPEAMYLGLVSHWGDPTSLVIGGREPRTALTDRARWPAFRDPAGRMMYLDLVTYLPDDILAKVDRASMGVGLEARVPYLDHRVVELAWRLPPALRAAPGETKRLLRRVLTRYVPRSLTDRPKAGFGVPIGAWLRGPLREWAEDLLDVRRLRADGYLRPEPVRSAWSEHLSGRRNRQYELWDVLMFQAWIEATAGAVAASEAGVLRGAG